MKKKIVVSPDVFNYPLFRADISKKCREMNLPLTDVSEKKFYRHKDYLSESLRKKKLPLNIIIGLCDYFDLSLKEYEIRTVAAKPNPISQQTPPAEAEPAKAEIPTICDSVPLVFNIVFGGTIYTCETKVFSDLRIVSSTLSCGDTVVGKGRGNFHSESVNAILRSMSYSIYDLGKELKDCGI